MAQQLDFSPLDQRAQIYRDKARRDEMNLRASEQVAKGIFDVVDWQQDMKQKFAEASEFDYDITLDAQANAYLANRYDQALKQPHIEAIMGKRWKTQDHVNKMLASQKQLEREATNVKGMVQARQQAEQAVIQNPSLYTMDEDAVKGFESFLMGKTDVKNGNAYLMGLQGNDGTPPFLQIKTHNIDDAIGEIMMDVSRDPRFTNTITEIKSRVDGDKTIKVSNKKAAFDEALKEGIGGYVANELKTSNKYKSLLPGMGRDASNKLQKEGAAYGDIEAIEAYAVNQFDYNPYFQEREVASTTTEAPVKEDSEKVSAADKKFLNLLDKDGKPMETKFGVTSNNFVDYSLQPPSVNELENFILPKTAEEVVVGEVAKGGESGAEGVKATGTRRQSAKGIGKPVTYKVLGHDKENGEFWLVEKSGRKQIPVDEFGNTSKAESLDHIITVPEEEIISLRTGEYTPREKAEPKTEATERIPEFITTKKTNKASNEDMEAIEWIRDNPEDPRSKDIYESLKQGGLIK